MKKVLFLVFCICSMQAMVLGQDKELATFDEVSRLSDDILKAIETGNTEQALEMIQNNLSNKQKNTKDLASFLKNAGEKYGDLEGTSFAKKEEVGNFLIRCTYALKYKECPLWIQFIYYKPDEKFGLKKVEWGDNVEKLF